MMDDAKEAREGDSRSGSSALLSAWQPMKTAPKDGREILLTVEVRAGMPSKCLVGHWMPGGHCIEDHPAIAEGWYFWNGCMFDKASKPTHWLPLPPVPSAADPHRANRQLDRQLPNANRDRVGG